MSGRGWVIRRSAELERTRRGARRRADEACARVARRALAGGPLDEKHGAAAGVARFRDLEAKLAGWRARLASSLDQDRADYAIVEGLARWLVVARGALDRFVVRERVRFTERELERAAAELGARLVERADAELLARVAPQDVDDARAAAHEAELAAEERAELLAPYGGDPWPPVLRELRSFGRFVWQGLRTRILPRAPVLVGLIAGWWIAQTFTDSWWESARARFGGSSKVAVSRGTLETLRFWGPLVAAALCGYLGAFLSSRVHRRYAGPTRTRDSGAGG